MESTVSDDLARKKFTELKERAGQRLVTGPERVLIPDADLDEFWSTLEPATIDFMIGEWIGGEFDTGHRETERWRRSTGSARPSFRPPM